MGELTYMGVLGLAAGWVIVVFVAGVGAAILFYIFTGKIDLKFLISEENGHASMSLILKEVKRAPFLVTNPILLNRSAIDGIDSPDARSSNISAIARASSSTMTGTRLLESVT